MADIDRVSARARPGDAAPASAFRADVPTAVFTAVSAIVFLILIGCVAAAAFLFSQGI